MKQAVERTGQALSAISRQAAVLAMRGVIVVGLSIAWVVARIFFVQP